MKSSPPALLPALGLLLLISCSALKPTGSSTTNRGRAPRPPSGAVYGDATSFIRTDITQHAQELLGTAYKWGGNRPGEGFDCSGLVVYLYQNAGLDLNRVSRDQAKQGNQIKLSEARPGDLVFFKRPGGAVFHVSVVVLAAAGELWVIHSTSSRGVIRENVLASSYWKPKLHQVRRVIR